MAKRIPIIILFLLLLNGTGCWRPEIAPFTVDIHPAPSPECATFLLERLNQVDGIEDAEYDPSGVIRVTYKGTVIAKKNIEFVIAGMGFDANTTPGDPAARDNLPPACR